MSAVLFAALVAGPAGWCQQAPAAAQPAPQAEPAPQTEPAPHTPIAKKKIELQGFNPWKAAWDRMIERAIPRDLVSRNRAEAVRPLCPRFRSMSRTDRRAFWAYFFQALAGAEAGLQPTADSRHTDPAVAVIDPVTHETIRQEGLLQLAYADQRRYGCHFDWDRDRPLPERDPAKTILSPRNNLLCGIRILHAQLIKHHKPLLTNSSYWVTLRPSTYSFTLFFKQMANVPAACGVPLDPSSLPPASEAAESQPAKQVPANRLASRSLASRSRATAPQGSAESADAFSQVSEPRP